MDRKKFLEEQFGTNPFEDIGLTPEIVKQIQEVGSTDALRTAAKGVQRAISSAIHPDKTGGSTPQLFFDITDASERIDKLNDTQVSDFATAFTKPKKSRSKETVTLEVDNPLQVAALRSVSSSVLNGELISSELQSAVEISLSNGIRNTYIYRHEPGEKLVRLGGLRGHEVDDKIRKLSNSISNASWWSDVSEDFKADDYGTGPRTEVNRDVRTIYVDLRDIKSGIIFDAATGNPIETFVIPEYLDGYKGIFSIDRSTKYVRPRGQHKLNAESYAHARTWNQYYDEEPTELPFELIGAVSKEYRSIAWEEVQAKNHELSEANSELLLLNDAGNDSNFISEEQLLYVRKAIDAHLNTVQKEALAEYFFPILKLGSTALGVDRDKDVMTLLGNINFKFKN